MSNSNWLRVILILRILTSIETCLLSIGENKLVNNQNRNTKEWRNISNFLNGSKQTATFITNNIFLDNEWIVEGMIAESIIKDISIWVLKERRYNIYKV